MPVHLTRAPYQKSVASNNCLGIYCMTPEQKHNERTRTQNVPSQLSDFNVLHVLTKNKTPTHILPEEEEKSLE